MILLVNPAVLGVLIVVVRCVLPPGARRDASSWDCGTPGDCPRDEWLAVLPLAPAATSGWELACPAGTFSERR